MAITYPGKVDAIEQQATIFKALAYPARLQILRVLMQNHDSISVERIGETLEIEQPSVSLHLSVLKKAGLVERRRDGMYIYYRACRPAVVSEILALALDATRNGGQP